MIMNLQLITVKQIIVISFLFCSFYINIIICLIIVQQNKHSSVEEIKLKPEHLLSVSS